MLNYIVSATCKEHNTTKVLEMRSGDTICKSKVPYLITFCAGGCGTSSNMPTLMLSGGNSDGVKKDCKCCAGEIGSYQPVEIECIGPNKNSLGNTAMLPVLKANSCKCDACIKTGTYKELYILHFLWIGRASVNSNPRCLNVLYMYDVKYPIHDEKLTLI